MEIMAIQTDSATDGPIKEEAETQSKVVAKILL